MTLVIREDEREGSSLRVIEEEARGRCMRKYGIFILEESQERCVLIGSRICFYGRRGSKRCRLVYFITAKTRSKYRKEKFFSNNLILIIAGKRVTRFHSCLSPSLSLSLFRWQLFEQSFKSDLGNEKTIHFLCGILSHFPSVQAVYKY